jgi:hypothetical protein
MQNINHTEQKKHKENESMFKSLFSENVKKNPKISFFLEIKMITF